MITQLADTAMVGRYLGKTSLAATSLANSVFVLYLMLIIGLATGITTKIGNYHGEKNEEGIARANSSGFWTMLLLIVPLAIFAWSTDSVLGLLDWPELVVAEAKPYYRVLCWSIIPLAIFMALKHFIDGLEITIPAMIASLASNVLNVFLNYLLIEGNWGFEAYGLLGAGYATFIARIALVGFIIWVVVRKPKFRQYSRYILKFKVFLSECRSVISIGLPVGLQYLMEGGAFVLGAIMVGWLGESNASAHHIAIMIASLTFMFASGLGSAATIRLSNLIGAKQHDRMVLVTKSFYIMILVLQVFFALSIYVFNKELPAIFIEAGDVIQIASVLLLWAALFQITDGIQLVASGLLRGAADVKIPTLIAGISYWVIAIPLGYYLLKSTDLGASSIWVGYTLGLSFSAALLSWRVVMVLKKIRASGG